MKDNTQQNIQDSGLPSRPLNCSTARVGKPRICEIHARENCARCIFHGGKFIEQDDKETNLEFELFQAANDALWVLENLGLSKTKQSEKAATRLREAISDYMNR